MGLGRLTHYNLARVGNQAVTLIVIVLCCWMFRDVTVAVIAYVAGSTLGALFLIISLMRLRLASRLAFSWRMITACYRYGVKYYFGKLATLVDVQMGVIVIAMVGTTDQAGLFAAALGLVSRLWILPETLNVVLLPRVMSGQSALADLVVRSARMAMIVTFLAGCLLAALSKPIVAILLSPAFLPAVTPLLILLPGVVMGCQARVLISYFNGTGRPEFTSFTLVVGLVFNVTLIILLLPRWGLAGAATATSVAYIIEAILAIFLFIRLTRCSRWSFLPRMADYQTAWNLIRRRGRPEVDSVELGETSK
jgi:O-antigen/teichoic acid export membrane protein